jgi:hypothetical protein
MSFEFPSSFIDTSRMGVINALWINFPGGAQPSLLFPPLSDDRGSLGFRLLLTGRFQESAIGIQLFRETDTAVVALCGSIPPTVSHISHAAFEPFPADCRAWKKALARGPQAVRDLWASGAITSPVGAPIVLSSNGYAPMALMASVVMRASLAQLGARLDHEDGDFVLESLDKAEQLIRDGGVVGYWSSEDLDLIRVATMVIPALRSAYEQVILASMAAPLENSVDHPTERSGRKM